MGKRYWFALVLMALARGALATEPGPAIKIIHGLHETVRIQELGITLPAKLDTGAESASLSADNVRIFSRDGREMVAFTLALDQPARKKWGIGEPGLDRIELPLVEHVRIKRRAESTARAEQSYVRRPVVALTLCVGDRSARVDVNLTDRRDFSYPLLVGSQALRALGALVDPAVSMSKGQPACARESSGPKAE